MNKEVKEIIKGLEGVVKKPKTTLFDIPCPNVYILNPEGAKILLKYITSLEEKVETEHKAYMGTVQELTETTTEKEKLNNIINELEKWIKEKDKYSTTLKPTIYIGEIQTKLKELKELKGSDK